MIDESRVRRSCHLGAEVVGIDIAWMSGSGVPQWPVLSL
jgi:hypothetical protein